MKREVKIGIFAIIMIGCAWAGSKFLSGVDIFSRNVNYTATYENILGIQSASAVMIRGVKVGTVTDIALDPNNNEEVEITLTVKRRYQIPADSRATIINNGIMGGKVIDISLGESTQLLAEGSSITTVSEPDLFATAGTEVTKITTQLEALSTELNHTLKSVNTLLDANNENLNGLLTNLNGISGSLDQLLKAEQKNLQRTLGGFAEFAETLGANSERMDSILLNMTAVSTQLKDANLGESLGKSLEGVNSLLATLNEAEGSAGKLLNDEALYNNLSSASLNLSTLLGDFQDNPHRYVHFSLFGRNEEKQNAKELKKSQRDSLKSAK